MKYLQQVLYDVRVRDKSLGWLTFQGLQEVAEQLVREGAGVSDHSGGLPHVEGHHRRVARSYRRREIATAKCLTLLLSLTLPLFSLNPPSNLNFLLDSVSLSSKRN